jgi:hypothetical protein
LISSIFVAFFKSSRFFCVILYIAEITHIVCSVCNKSLISYEYFRVPCCEFAVAKAPY